MHTEGLVRRLRLPVGLGCAVLLGACAQQPKSLYDWQSYQPVVYSYLQDDGGDYAAQIQALEKNSETARANSLALPPGFRAQLGLLYLKQGQGDKAFAHFDAEKHAFPEAAPFMDFLMRNQRVPASVPASPERTAPIKALGVGG